MKTLLVITAFTCCFCMVAPSSIYAQASPNTSNNGNGKKSYVLMQHGKVMLVENGQSVEMTVVTTLKDGKKISPDGTIINKDGKKWKLNEGESIDMHGAVKKK